jgi:hypothetical protein
MPFALLQAVSAARREAASDPLAAGTGMPRFGFLAIARQAKRDGLTVNSIRQSARLSLQDLRLSSRALSSVSRIDSDHPPCSLRANAMPRKASCAGTTVAAFGTHAPIGSVKHHGAQARQKRRTERPDRLGPIANSPARTPATDLKFRRAVFEQHGSVLGREHDRLVAVSRPPG